MNASWKALLGFILLSSTANAAAVATSSASTVTGLKPFGTLPPDADNGQPILPNIFDPKAVNAQSVCPGYKVAKVSRQPYGLTATLNLAGRACNVYGDDVESLTLTMQYQSGDRMHLEIAPTYVGSKNQSWFYPPPQLRSASLDPDAANTVPLNDLEFVYGDSPSFWMKVIRKSNSDVLFDTSGTVLVFENQFVEFATALPEDYSLYGLGETIHSLRLGNNFTKTMWNSDNADTVDRNIYGTHPIYYDTRYFETATDGTTTYVPWNHTKLGGNYTSLTHAVYYRNAHGHEILMKPDGFTWRTLGGNIDLYFYSGPTIEQAAKSYQNSTIGLPAMQQYWTFGYHQCRWGYNNWSEVEAVVNNFERFQIPLETQWNDIDYMYQLRDFTSDPNRFNVETGLKFLNSLHASGRHYVHIVDSAIYDPNPKNASDAYDTYTRGHEANAFLLNPDRSEYVGAVWPGYTVFPDWLANGTQSWWTKELMISHNNVTFDGIWIDMSEVSSFCVGSCGTGMLGNNPVAGTISDAPVIGYPEGFGNTNASEAKSASSASVAAMKTQAPASTTTSFLRSTPTPGARNINYPPYAINNIAYDLAVHGASPNATHQDGTVEYDVHNMWGFGILNATYNGLASVFLGKRPFIIGRSTYAGAGTVAGHWGGDNYSQWLYMFFSIPQALSMSLFGIPMFGVDTCGFNDNTDEELCNRWMQLSAFFPFYRNHNTIGAISQEPYVWASVATATKTAMQIRYSLLPYIYTTFYAAHTTGSTVMRALVWEFPFEPLLASADRQFLLGPSILVTPVLEQGATSVSGVFPGASTGTVWYDWYNQTAITNPAAMRGANVSIPAPLGHIPVFVRGGSVLPMQPLLSALTVKQVRTQAWALLVGLDANGAATGSLYLDDGESIKPSSTLDVSMTVAKQTLYASGIGEFTEPQPLANVTIMGVKNPVHNVTFNEKPIKGFKYDAASHLLQITGLQSMTAKGAWSQDFQLTWA